MLRNRRQRQRVILVTIVVLATALSAFQTRGQFYENNLQAAVYDYVITGAPAKVKEGVSKQEAEEIKKKFEEVGAKVKIA